MGSLGQLRAAMTTSVVLTLLVFLVFMVALAIAVEYLITLELPLIWIFLGSTGLAGLFALIQYAIGPALVTMSTGLTYLKEGENPWLESTVKKLSEKSGLKMPRLATVNARSPNAFVFGHGEGDATLTVHTGLLKELTEEEIEGVLAHELGHIKHRDFVVMTMLSAIPLMAYLVARLAFESTRYARPSGDRKKGGAFAAILVAGVVSIAIYYITQLLVLRLSRLREFYADAYSAYLTGTPHRLASALTKIAYGLSLVPPRKLGGVRAFLISDPALAKSEVSAIVERKPKYDLDRDGVIDERELELAMEEEAKSTWQKVNTAFSTHPPTYKRILQLRQIGEEMETGRYTSEGLYRHI